jgi:hypothetical protein
VCVSDDDRIRFLSSYETRVVPRGGDSAKPVWPKTPDTLEALRIDIGITRLKSAGPPAHPVAPRTRWGDYNVLITGAGFEIQGRNAATGLPKTAELLNDLERYAMPLPRFPPPSPDYQPEVRERIVFERQQAGFPFIARGFAYEIDAQVRHAALAGNLEVVRHDRIGGWVRDPALPGTPVALVVLANGAEIGRVTADRYRSDLAAAGIGDGRHAFEWPSLALSVGAGATGTLAQPGHQPEHDINDPDVSDAGLRTLTPAKTPAKLCSIAVSNPFAAGKVSGEPGSWAPSASRCTCISQACRTDRPGIVSSKAWRPSPIPASSRSTR